MADTVRVHGLKDLNRALKRTSKDVRLGIRKELRGVAEPIRREAETLAVVSISKIGKEWWKMRVGVTLDTVYVAPKQRGSKNKARSDRRRRADRAFADRLINEAMDPALAHHAEDAQREVGEMLDRVANNFSR